MMRLLSFVWMFFVMTSPVYAIDMTWDVPFKNEVIKYAIEKSGVKVGVAYIACDGLVGFKDKSAYLISFKADGNNFSDEERIYVDTITGKPFKVLRDINIFGNKENITEEYFPLEGKLVITKINTGKTTQEIIKKEGAIDNIYAIIYNYRWKRNFTIGDSIALNLPTRDVSLTIKKTQKIKVGDKLYDALYMSSLHSEYQIWFDAGPQRIPLKINGVIGSENMTMYLESYKPGQLVY